MSLISPEELVRVRRGGLAVRVVHVGPDELWQSRRIPGAGHVNPVASENPAANMLAENGHHDLLVLYHDYGPAASGIVPDAIREMIAAFMKSSAARPEIMILEGGVDAWSDAGLPLEHGPQSERFRSGNGPAGDC